MTSNPDWRTENERLFEAHDMCEYRPPRFTDGELVTEVVATLETRHDVTIRLRAVNPQRNNGWALEINGERIATLDRKRTDDGYTVYQFDSNTFREVVTEHCESQLD